MVLGLEADRTLQDLPAPCAAGREPDDYLLVRHAEHHFLAFEVVGLPELLELPNEDLEVGDLTIFYDAVRQPPVAGVLERVISAATGDLDGLYRAAVYIQANRLRT